MVASLLARRTGYLVSPETELLLLVAGSLFSGDTFYEGDLSRRERFYELARALSQKDPHLWPLWPSTPVRF
jgi:hypothetical protein